MLRELKEVEENSFSIIIIMIIIIIITTIFSFSKENL